MMILSELRRGGKDDMKWEGIFLAKCQKSLEELEKVRLWYFLLMKDFLVSQRFVNLMTTFSSISIVTRRGLNHIS